MQRNKEFYLNLLRTIFGGERPLARLLKNDSGYFFYDTGTNKVVGCSKEVFQLLHGLFTKDVDSAVREFTGHYGDEAFIDTAAEIMEAVDREKMLMLKRATRFGLSEHFHDIDEELQTNVHSITLEVTQDCNLRCEYCIYQDHVTGKRNFEKKNMSLEVARKAIDFLKDHSSGAEEYSIGFYGGEPLMRFPFVKSCVEYAKQVLDEKPLIFNMTTNATLVTQEIADYLLNEDFSVMVSLDGPEDVHDALRKDLKGDGSFDRTMRGLKLLVNALNKIQKGMVSLNMVYAPPYSGNKIEKIDAFVKSLDWMPDSFAALQYANSGSFHEARFTHKEWHQDLDLVQWGYNKYKLDFRETGILARQQVEKKFAELMQRPVLDEPVDSFRLNGCCMPGSRKNFIKPDGAIFICEKMPENSPAIGHVDTGYRMDIIKKEYIDRYSEKSIGTCSRCWGIRLCDVCYIHAINEDGDFDIDRKTGNCISVLTSLHRSLSNFSSLLAEHPDKVEYLSRYDIK